MRGEGARFVLTVTLITKAQTRQHPPAQHVYNMVTNSCSLSPSVSPPSLAIHASRDSNPPADPPEAWPIPNSSSVAGRSRAHGLQREEDKRRGMQAENDVGPGATSRRRGWQKRRRSRRMR